MTDERDPLGPVFERYRAACPEMDGGSAFLPRIWERIEARRNWIWKLRGYTRGLVTVAATLCLALLAFEMSPLANTNPLYMKSYLEALDDDAAPETLTYLDIVTHVDFDGNLQ